MTQTNILGVLVVVAGAVLLGFAWRASQAPLDQMSQAVTGRFMDRTMWYLLGGVVAVLGGIALMFRGAMHG